MNAKKIILLYSLVIMLASCLDFLEPYPRAEYSREDIWEYQEMVKGLVEQCYDYLPRNYNDIEGAYMDCATDNAVRTNTSSSIRKFAVGAITPNQDPFQTFWDRDYKAINLLNMFLEDRKGYNTRYLIDGYVNNLVRERLQGEAFGLRAWFQWDLLQKFGGMGMNGQLLGYPIILKPLDITKEINLERNTYDECVQQILADCDSAYKYLAIAHRDFLVKNDRDLTYAGSRYWGRIDGVTVRAIKSLVYLTWASPRFNPDNDVSRWDMAAKYAKEVMDFKLEIDGGVSGGFDFEDGVNWFNPNFPGIIWSARYLDKNDNMERMFYPGGFMGEGSMGATQDLVDAFPMKNGYPITDERSGYDPENPYKDRDPRFYSTIFYNGSMAIREGKTEVMYTFENWGKDAAGEKSNNSRTNYHIKKFVAMVTNWSDPVVNRYPHSKYYIRWAHMVLTFAEAANQVVGPLEAARYGISAKDALAFLRSRKTYDGAQGYSTDPYLDEMAAAGKTVFDEFIKNERRIETCFEGDRFYDLRRWASSIIDLNEPVHGALVQKKEDGSFEYSLKHIVEDRSFTSFYLPIPYSEILKMSNLVQNEGWENWK